MIPRGIVNNYKIIEYPSRTYFIGKDKKRIIGMTDGQEAVKQAIYKMLMTERYDYLIYDYNYGIEIKTLFGKDPHIACAVLERRIKDALSVDDRIIDTYDFIFTVNKSTVNVEFTVKTQFGEIREEVSLDVWKLYLWKYFK